MCEPYRPSAEAFEQRSGGARTALQPFLLHAEPAWALEALRAARMMPYAIDVAAGFMVRAGNCTEVVGLLPAGPAAAWCEAILAEDRMRYECALQGVSPQSPGFETEYRLVNQSTGTQVWALDRGAGEFDSEGRLRCLRGVIVDVSPLEGRGGVLRPAAALSPEVPAPATAAAWQFDLRRRVLHWSPEMFLFYGLDPVKGVPARDVLVHRIPPAHRQRARRAFARAALKGGAFTLEFPVMRAGAPEAWISLTGDVTTDEQGRPVSARGIGQDVTERKNWEKRQAMLLRELSHRVKNTLAVVQSLARQTLRSSPSTGRFVEAFEGRIRSLAASHSLLTEADWRGAMLENIIRHQVAALVDEGQDRIRLKGPALLLSAEVATQLGLVLHELATNAAKYGALSGPAGRVDIVWTVTKTRLRLVWREHGGPRITGEPEHAGFGSILIASSTIRATRCFRPGGLICKLEFAR